MYITRLQLKNVRCCVNFDLSLNGRPGASLICGNNGDGKSTVLRSLAMGLCDQSSAAALLRDLPGELVRDGQPKAIIEVTLRSKNNAYFLIETTIESLKVFEKISQNIYKLKNGKKKKLNPDKFQWDKIFVSGYGPGIRTQGTADYQDYVPVDAVYPLFKYDVPLQNPELGFRRIIDEARRKGKGVKDKSERAKRMKSHLLDLLKNVLNLSSKDKVILGSTGIKVQSTRWGKVGLNSLGDGYKAITTCVLDMLSWWMLYLKLQKKSINDDIEGIIIIDEIEQHLHPRWQLEICSLLKGVFPKVQFIMATHSPLVISGCKDARVCRISRGTFDDREFYGWLPDDIYTEIMDLKNIRPIEVEKEIKVFEELHLKKIKGIISKIEKFKLRKVQSKLTGYRGAGAEALTIEMKNLAKILKKK